MAKRLLLADDSQTIQRVVDIVLGPEGYKVTSFGNGDEAQKAVETLMPDIILADIEMPGLTGYQLCRKIKDNPSTAHIPVMLLAGAFEPFDEDLMKEAGADDYVLKPFESQELLSKVKSLLLQKEIVEVSMTGQAEEEVPEVEAVAEPAAEPVAAAAAAENEWYAQYGLSPELSAEERGESPVFEQELRESMKILEADLQKEAEPLVGPVKAEEPEVEPEMSLEDISRMVKDAVGVQAEVKEYIAEAPAPEGRPVEEAAPAAAPYVAGDFSRSLTDSLRSIIEKAVRDQLTAMLPGILENSLQQALSEITSPLQGMVKAEITKTVPEVAERIIKQEIQKITSELA
jgi:CheY-like chemotaxis protein